MKSQIFRIFLSWLLIFTGLPISAQTINNQTNFQKLDVKRNWVKNPNCEYNTSEITVSSGTTAQATQNSEKFCQWNTPATSGATMDFQIQSPTGALASIYSNCAAYVSIFTVSGEANFKMSIVHDGTIKNSRTEKADTWPKTYEITYPCELSLAIDRDLRIETTDTSGVDVYVKAVYKEFDGVGSANESTGWADAGPMTITGSVSNPTKGTSTVDRVLWRREGSNARIRFERRQTAAGLAGSGNYIWQIPASIGVIDTDKIDVGGTTARSYVGQGMFDQNGASGFLVNMVAKSSSTVSALVQNAVGGSPSLIYVGSSYSAMNQTNQDQVFEIVVPIAGWSASQVVRMNVPPSGVWQSYTPTITSATGALTNYTVSAQWMRVGESAFYRGSITFTGAPGTWNAPRFSLPPGQTLAGTDYYDVMTQTAKLIDNGTQVYIGVAEPSGADKIQIAASGSGAYAALTQASPFTWVSGDKIGWTIGPLKISEFAGMASVNMPLIDGGVTSDYGGALKINAVRVGASDASGARCTTSPCTIASQTGSWISSITRASGGNYTANFNTGKFKNTPYCWVNGYNAGISAVPICATLANGTNALVNIGCSNDAVFTLMCIGD